MPPIIIYTQKTSPRLDYVLHWLFDDQLKTGYILASTPQEIETGSFIICYGTQLPAALSIPDAGLLWQQGTPQQEIEIGNWQEVPTIFATRSEGYSIPFDIFSAIFFLLTRYEEYYAYTPDKYGRYPATQSILYKNGWLRRPLVDEWLGQLRQLLNIQFGFSLPSAQFTFQPTYDIDIAYSYLHKGYVRNAGGFAKDFLSGRLRRVNERMKVLRGTKKDPYDSFEFLAHLHEDQPTVPVYFILAALQNTPHDKNILPTLPAMRTLLQQLASYAQIGLHPSFTTDVKPANWHAERNTLAQITGQSILVSRQHYIKMKLPDTYRFLEANGITEDYSMGYGTHLGFRAGTGQAFRWYDIQQEKTSPLVINPFCFMDTTAHYEERLSVDEAFKVLNEMTGTLQASGSRLITVFHNFSLGSDVVWRGWAENYKWFLQHLQ